MQDFGPKPRINDLDKLLFMLCKGKHLKHAQEFFNGVKLELSPSEKTYSILMSSWVKCETLRRHGNSLMKCLSGKCPIDVTVYNTLLGCLCQDGKTEEAHRLFREMESCGLQPDACSYSIFILAYCEANDAHSALRVLVRMRRYSLAPNVGTNEFTFNFIIKLFCKNDCVNQALKLINRMDKDSCLPDYHT
ncbi:hypothetical protein NE237_010959 [Protea cynaroides]|uniref:Pentatricopeptide repeat-containing protein n=1 Tax=Protea cynaroides TaxID=273540 RepID=A0A9Q0L0P3_9MAGN|nr:hypothetical protein NE237_010959 [Protea cynaroides]